MVFMVFLMMWYVDSSFFHYFWSFRGRYLPYLDVSLVSVGTGGAVHVSFMVFDMFSTILSIYSHTYCHWLCGSFVLFCRIFINWCIRVVLFSENLIQNWLMFSVGIGFSIFGLLGFGVGRGFLDIMLLGGIYRFIG
jgi:hypothetical protein